MKKKYHIIQMYFTIIDRRDMVQPFSWEAALRHIDMQLTAQDHPYHVVSGTFVRDLAAWKALYDDPVFVPLNPTHEEVQTGQVFELACRVGLPVNP